MTHEQLADALADRYLLDEELGRGSSATVYLAQDLRHGRRVALKVLHSALGQALGVERFQREIRTQARLHHPHILPVFDSGVAAGHLYYVMPHVETGTLQDRLERQGPLTVAAAVQVGREVASALSFAHALGVIHRDLKPENIVFSPMGHAILADFGIAVAVDGTTGGPRLTETGVAVGTPVYMSPEQSAGDEVLDGRSDQYSLAAVIYEALSGVPPFTGPNARAIFAQKLTEMPPPIRERRPDVPTALDRVVLRALERSRESRYGTIDEFAAALAEASTAPETAAPSDPAPSGPTQASAARDGVPRTVAGPATVRRRWRLAALVVGALMLTGARGIAVQEPGRPRRSVFRRRPDRGDHQPARGALRAPGDQPDQRRPVPPQPPVGPHHRRRVGGGLRAGGERAVGHGLGGPGAAPGDAAADRGGRGQPSVGGALRGAAGGGVPAAVGDRGAGDDGAGRGAPGAGADRAGGGGYPERRSLRLLPPRQRISLTRHRPLRLLAAIDLYRRAALLDSTFAAALARLSRVQAAMYWFYYDHSPERLADAKRAADAALGVAPELADAHVALGYYWYWGHLDYERALAEFQTARRLQPSNSEVLGAIGYVERRRGRWDEAVAHFQEAIAVDPVSQQRAFDLGDTYLTLRRFPEAERQLDRTIQLAPDWAKPYGYKAMLYLMWKGDRARARAVIGQAMSRVSTGRLARGLMTADAISASVISSDSLFFPAADAVRADGFEADTGAYYLFKAEVAHYRADPALERAYADSARRWLQPQLLTQPDDAKRLVHYGLASARAGRKADALRAGRRAVALLPLSLDAASGPFIQTYLAQIYLLNGDLDNTVATLRPLLAFPSWITPEELASDPLWAPLKSHPGYASLLATP
jgi:Flp pilus assembly protein TadD/tRNA A-37 threonylcarbamoyl transferase component Bud32